MAKLSLKALECRGKRVLVRVDFNVPLTDALTVADDTRIRETLPTLRLLSEKGARSILVSHLGRPDGKPVDKLRMAPVAKKLSELLGRPVPSVSDCIGAAAEKAAASIPDAGFLLLENVRFHAGEEKNDPAFAKQLAALAELYVNDAFGTAHRAHASTQGVPLLLKPAAAGLLMEKELSYLGRLLENPERPFLAILGGKKVSDKIQVIENLLPRVDRLLIGGGMAFTFLKAQGRAIGTSVLEADKVDLAKSLLERAGSKLMLPADTRATDRLSWDGNRRDVPMDQDIPEKMTGADIGPKAIAEFSAEIAKAKTIFWNGPMGIFELEPFAAGTFAIAEAVAACTGTTVIGGGDSVSAVHSAGVADKISHISTGGGASLEFIEGRKLPGVEALSEA